MKYYGHLMAPPSSSGSCLSCVWSLYINWVVYSALIITYRRWNNDDMYMFAWPWPILWEDASASITAIVNSWIKHNFCLWHSASFITLFCFWSWYKSVFWSLFQLPLNCFELISGLLMFFSVIQHPCDLFTCLVTKSFKLNFVASWFTIFFSFFFFTYILLIWLVLRIHWLYGQKLMDTRCDLCMGTLCIVESKKSTDWVIIFGSAMPLVRSNDNPAVIEVELCDGSEFYFRNVFQKLWQMLKSVLMRPHIKEINVVIDEFRFHCLCKYFSWPSSS